MATLDGGPDPNRPTTPNLTLTDTEDARKPTHPD